MNDPDERQHEVTAANVLLKHPEAPALYEQMVKLLSLPDTVKAVLYDEGALLNPLIRLARRDRTRYNTVISVIEAKRAEQGFAPLVPDVDDKFDKNKYQRELMASIRLRTFKAAAIENLRRPPSGQLIGHSRLEFMRVQRGKWMAQLEALLEAKRVEIKNKTVPGATRPGDGLHKWATTMTKNQRQIISGQFWDRVDQELEEAEAKVYQWMQSGRVGPAP